MLLLGYIFFSRAAAPGLRFVIRQLAWKWLCADPSSSGVFAHRVRDLALRKNHSGLLQLWQQHVQQAEREQAAEAARWVLGLIVAANMACGLFYPTFSQWLYQLSMLDGLGPTLARAMIFFAFIGVVLRTWETLVIDDRHDKMYNLPRDIEKELQEHRGQEMGITPSNQLLSTPPVRPDSDKRPA